MKTLIFSLLLAQLSFATCISMRTVCSSDVNFENIYEIRKVSCAAPGGPINWTAHLNIYNKLSGPKALVSKKFNTTRDNYFQAEIRTVAKVSFLTIDDRSLSTATNVNISTNHTTPKELFGYVCKDSFQ